MTRELILGTAGHIDHGKTSLVRALTGTDCDRLPEEKARGITIDIGFARLDVGGRRLGIIDVPGHERFIRNMLAGATGVDLALLVVAADDSVMPQTREHLEILQLLGLSRGVVAVTKADLVDADTRAVVGLEIRELVRATFLADAPIVFTSAATGEGIGELRDAIRAAAVGARDGEVEALPFRLSIDRSFVVQGHGTVVTGTVASGTVTVGDELEWLPRRERVRVRGLHHHDEAVGEVRRGMRAAVNLAGVAHDDVRRGHELAAPGYLQASAVVTVAVRASAVSPRPLKHRQPVRLHVGAAEVVGVLALLDADELSPGESGFGQLLLDEPVAVTWGQPFVLRESSAGSTVGGGRVLQPVPRKFRRRHVELVEALAELVPGVGDEVERVAAVARFAGAAGVRAADLPRDAGVPTERAEAVLRSLAESGQLIELAGKLVHAAAVAELEQRLTAALAELHGQNPLMTAQLRVRVESRLEDVGDAELVRRVVDRLIARKSWTGDAARVALAEFRPKLSANQRKLKDRIVSECRSRPYQPPEPAEIAKEAAGLAAGVPDLFEVAAAEGHLVRVSGEIYLAAEAETAMRQKLRDTLADGRALTVAEIRDLLGTTRKYAVPLCEYLDKIGVTRRDGDGRVAARSGQGATNSSSVSGSLGDNT